LLYAGYWEGESYFLIDHATAKRDTLNGMPDFSPNAKRVLSYYVNPYGEGESLLSADIAIYNLSETGLVSLHKKAYDYIPYDIRWKDDNTILIKALSGDEFYETQAARNNEKKAQHFFYKKIVLR
jgi:hypothetical protein